MRKSSAMKYERMKILTNKRLLLDYISHYYEFTQSRVVKTVTQASISTAATNTYWLINKHRTAVYIFRFNIKSTLLMKVETILLQEILLFFFSFTYLYFYLFFPYFYLPFQFDLQNLYFILKVGLHIHKFPVSNNKCAAQHANKIYHLQMKFYTF